MLDEANRDDDMSVPLFEIRCSVTDPKQCVLYITHGGLGMPDDGDGWMWMQECYHCGHSQFTVTPFLHTRRKYGPGVRQSGNDCRKLTDYTDGETEPDEYDKLVARIEKDLAETVPVSLAP